MCVEDLDYMHSRYCSPGLGRFLSVDPESSSSDAKRPQTWNRYVYALNNPIKYIDPDGKVFQQPQDLSTVEQFLLDLSRDSATDIVPLQGTARAAARAGAGPAATLLGRLSRPIGSRLAARFPAIARLAFKRTERLLKPGGEKIGVPLSSDVIRQAGGGVKAAQSLFDKLTGFFGKSVKVATSDEVTKAVIPGVGTVQLRTVQSGDQFVATIDIRITGIGTEEIKFLPE